MELESPLFFDRDANPIDLDTFLSLRADHAYRFLAREAVGELEVVTTWLGMDQGPDAFPERPLIFGTAAPIGGGNFYADVELFAADAEEAMANHRELVARVTAGLLLEA